MDTNNAVYPDPSLVYPIKGFDRICFLKNIITNPQIIVGDYTYYDDPEDINNFQKNVLYLFDFIGDHLIIGKYCQIASQVKFIMNGANHPSRDVSTFPFHIFNGEWEQFPRSGVNKGDTIIGNDVWIGNSAVFMPGVQVGDGAIIASHSVVTRNVEPYTIVGGNPAKVIRKRFDDETIALLLKLKWWDLPLDEITRIMPALVTDDVTKLKQYLK
jgi:virginiamycin A acetyltransferase